MRVREGESRPCWLRRSTHGMTPRQPHISAVAGALVQPARGLPCGKSPSPRHDKVLESLDDDGQRIFRTLLDGAASADSEIHAGACP